MVASGVASKGLDFNDIQHVIIFSMPKEIEDYVHQIGTYFMLSLLCARL